ADLRNLVEGVFDHLELEAPSPGPGAEDKVEKLALEPVSAAVEVSEPATRPKRYPDPLDAAFDQFFQEGNMQAFLVAVEKGGLEEFFSMSVDWTLGLKPVDLDDKATELIRDQAVSW
ncbi:MAG: hypothetical protein KDC85_11730, partial [Saprospiraceae bacterium]|nr:hypothetical protein [Saprospiraceae bacterium]